MPSALRASRDFMARALSGIRSGLGRYEENLDRAGPDIRVEPFDAHNVSTPAALIKLGTTIAASRRARANRAAAQQDVELEREKTRAEIARLRADTARLGRVEGPAAAPTLTPYQVKALDLAERREARVAASDKTRETRLSRSDAERRGRQGKLANAKAALREIELRSGRESEAMTTAEMAKAEPGFMRGIGSKDKNVRKDAATRLGINPKQFERSKADKTGMVRQALTNLRARTLERRKRNVDQFYARDRARLLETIDEEGAWLSTEQAPENTGGAPAQEDPLDAFYSQ